MKYDRFGSVNPRWNSGTSNGCINRKSYDALRYRNCDFTKCEKCGKEIKNLKGNAHHINRIRIDNRPKNISWLCTTCHKFIHQFKIRKLITKRRNKLIKLLEKRPYTTKELCKILRISKLTLQLDCKHLKDSVTHKKVITKRDANGHIYRTKGLWLLK